MTPRKATVHIVAVVVAYAVGFWTGEIRGDLHVTLSAPVPPEVSYKAYNRRLLPCAMQIDARHWNALDLRNATIYGGSVLVLGPREQFALSNVNVKSEEVGLYVDGGETR